MEINRIGNTFVIKLNDHRISLYWSKKLDFGKNIIERCCERITVKELENLDNAIKIANNNIAKNQQPTQEEQRLFYKSMIEISRIVKMQVHVFIKTLPTEDFENLINACYPSAINRMVSNIKKLYTKRFDGCECELERKLNDADSISDWIITRMLVTEYITQDLIELFKYSICSIGEQAINEMLTREPKASRSAMESFAIQLFRTKPYYEDFDKRAASPEIVKNILNDIKNTHNDICKFKDLQVASIQHSLDGFNINETNPSVVSNYIDQLWFDLRKDVNLLNDVNEIRRIGDLKRLCDEYITNTPRFTVIGELKPYEKSNEERRKIVLDLFKRWDANMPDDLKVIREEKEMAEAIAKQKQENVDKADIEYVGKTQAQINAEKENDGIVLQVKDENNSVIGESKVL
jgi:hypothetical protein